MGISVPRIRRAAVVAMIVLFAVGCGDSQDSATTTTTTSSSRVTTSSAVSPTEPPTTSTTPRAGQYLPLFPFGSLTEATAWQREDGPVHQPWRIDAGQTALAFARFLGYDEVDRVVNVSTDSSGAHVAVGYSAEGQDATAAVVHLVRYGSGRNAPWEVVGTDDTDFTIDTPAYRSGVTSPLPVGGRITGVDESIGVRVQQLHANGYLGERTGLPAGGQNMKWGTSLTFKRPTDPVLIVHASTGGHLQAVERFTVTGVRAG
jgi:hypothetical protein